MGNVFDNFIKGFAFGMAVPFFRGMGCCFGGGFMMQNTVDFGTFANGFPVIFNNTGMMNQSAPPILSTFSNNFPVIDFSAPCKTIWDNFTNPDSDYNKRMREMYKQMENMQIKSSEVSQTKIPQFEMPFSSFFMPPQISMNPFVSGFGNYFSSYSPVQAEKVSPTDTEKSNKKTKKPDNSSQVSSLSTSVTSPASENISYDAKELKDKWSKKHSQLTDKFYSRVVEISKKIKCSPDDLMALMNYETARTFSPSEKCGKSTATGLIQFTDATAKTLGTTIDKLKVMSAVEQLDYVEKYFIHWKKELGIKDQQLSTGDLYALVAQPANAKNEILIRQGTKAYADNAKNWDVNNDKVITKTDLATCLNKFRA